MCSICRYMEFFCVQKWHCILIVLQVGMVIKSAFLDHAIRTVFLISKDKVKRGDVLSYSFTFIPVAFVPFYFLHTVQYHMQFRSFTNFIV